MSTTVAAAASSVHNSATTSDNPSTESVPWTILTTGKDILLRSEDVVRLADRFLQASGENYSFANISIIDLATTLHERNRTVEVLSFNKRLAAYSADLSSG